MAFVLLTSREFQPFVSGNQLTSGKLKAYATGTTTAQTLYQDASGTPFPSPSNEVTLSATSGSTAIYLDTTKTYRLILEDGSGNEQWDIDPVGENDALPQGKRSETDTVAFPMVTFHQNRHLNLKTDFGAIGDGNSKEKDTQAIRDAIDAAFDEDGRVIEVPPGTYNIKETITLKRGASFLGAQGSTGQPMGGPEFLWDGAADGTMFETTEDTSQDPTNIAQTRIENINFKGETIEDPPGPPLRNPPATFFRIKDRVDYGWGFHRCAFFGCTGDALIFEKGATNFYMYDWRADHVEGYVIRVPQPSGTGIIGSFTCQLDKFTWDTGGIAATSTPRGLIRIDGEDSPASPAPSVVHQIQISNCVLEVNDDLDTTTVDAVIALGCQPAISSYVQYYLTLNNIFVPLGSGVTSADFIKAFYDTGEGPEDQILVNGVGVRVSSGLTLVAGTSTPGPDSSLHVPFFVYAPFTEGAPAVSHQQVQLVADLKTKKRFFQNDIITFANNDLTPSVAGGNLFEVNNDSIVTIGDLDDGEPGQIVTLLFEEDNTNIGGSQFLLKGGISWNDIEAGDTLTLIQDGAGKWREIARGDNT